MARVKRTGIGWVVPVVVVAALPLYADGSYYDTPQGSSRLKDWYQLNFSLEAAFPIVAPVELAVKADIFNVTNQQSLIDPTRVVLARGEDYGTPTSRNSFQAPRGYQFGAVVKF